MLCRDTNRFVDSIDFRNRGKRRAKNRRWESWGIMRKVHSICRRYSSSREESRQGQLWQKKAPIVSASSGCVMTTEYRHFDTQLKED